jgi:hypothetical protein
MRNGVTALALIAVVTGCTEPGIDTVTYRGEQIRLARKYPDFRAYKDDAENLRAEDIPRIARLIKSAPISPRFAARNEAFDAVINLTFPGYGFSAMGLDQPVALFAVEIPRMNEQRYFTVTERDGAWVVVEDFVWSSAQGLLQKAVVSADGIKYYDAEGILVRTQRGR